MAQLKFDQRNYRIHNDKNKRIIRKSLEECGAGRSILLDNDDYIIAGNGVYDQAKALGLRVRIVESDGSELIAIKRTDLSTEDVRRKTLALVDNYSSDTSSFDIDIIVEDFNAGELQDFEFMVDDFKIDDDRKEISDDGHEDLPEVEIKTDIKYGDSFIVEYNGVTNKLQCGDSSRYDDISKLMNGDLADMVFTDPPYDLADNYSSHIFSVVKDNCHVFIMNSDRLLIDNVMNGIQWFRKFFAVDFRQARLVSNNQPMTRVDLIAEFCKGKTKFNNLYDGFSTLVECCKIHNNNENINFGHKQAKRVELPGTFINHYTKEGELVCDFFGGSGSTLVAAMQLGRKCYIQEFEPKNCQIILNRIEKTFKDKCKISMI